MVWLCKPFIVCFARCRRQWDIQNSLVDAFATFLLLSYVKFFSVSIDLLTPTIVWNSKARIQQVALYYDGSMEYFGTTHLPYATMAISVLLVFIFLPTLLLCLYPCQCFQRLLNRWNCNGQVLHYFMDSFQGSFKNGTNGTRDCRYFAAIYLIARIVIHLGFIVTYNTFSTFVQTSLLLIMIVLLTCFQPYKFNFYTKLDICFLASLCLIVNSAWEINGKSAQTLSSHVNILYFLLLFVPILYLPCLLLHHYLRRVSRFRTILLDKLKMCYCNKVTRITTEAHETSSLLSVCS